MKVSWHARQRRWTLHGCARRAGMPPETIGVISHVEAMKERIPVQIKVKKINGLGYSRLDKEFAVQ